MPRWQETYDALTGERYADLLAYALMYVDDPDVARGRLDTALRSVLSRGRSFLSADAVETEVRREIARAVVASAARTPGPALHAVDDPPRDPEPSVFAPPDSDSPDTSAEPPRDDTLADHPLEAALSRLDPRTRAVLVLHHHDGHSVRRIAEITGMRAEEVATRLGAGGAELSTRAGVTVASADHDDALAGIELTVTTEPTDRRGRG